MDKQSKIDDYVEVDDTVHMTEFKMLNGMWHIWACKRPTGAYKGRYPDKFLERLFELIVDHDVIPDFDPEVTMILHQFGGTTPETANQHTCDISEEVDPTYLTDARKLEGILDETYDLVIADPPYDALNIDYSTKLYGSEIVKPYSFFKAGWRVLKPNGVYAVLHQLVYGHGSLPDNRKRIGVIGVTTGPNMRIRVLNLFRKEVDDTIQNVL